MTPVKLVKMNQNISKNCWKCKCVGGTFYHMQWTCKKNASILENGKESNTRDCWIYDIAETRVNFA